MVSDQELAHYVESLVRQTASRGVSAISADGVVRQLEAQLRVDLTPKVPLIRDILVALLGPAHGTGPTSRRDPFEAAASASAAPAAPSQPHFATPTASSQPHFATPAASSQPHFATPAAPSQPHFATPAAPSQPHFATSAAPSQPHFATSAAPSQPHFATSAAASASAPPPAPAVPHFFQQQMPSFLSASQQYHQHRPAAPAPPFQVPASYHYAQQPHRQLSEARQAGLNYLQRLQEEARQQQQQQGQQRHMAPDAAAAPATTPAESPRPPPAPAGSKKDSSATTGVKRRGGSGGLNKVCGVSPELQAIVGEPTMARTEIVKQLWAYIRRNNLQDPNNKRKIICNDELRLLFETDSTDMFKMNKLLAKHILPLQATEDSKRDVKKLKPADGQPISPAEADANQLPITMSDALANFLGTEEREMLHSEAVKRVWDHIKSNNLEDPANPTVILCDSKLKQLFGCESLTALGVSELLSQHLSSNLPKSN